MTFTQWVISIQWVLIMAMGTPHLGISQEIHIDHVISIESDLEKAIKDYRNMGFTIKRGRLHENGLINAHIKFQNISSFEIMSIEGEPKDNLSRKYDSLMKANIKGAYLALAGLSFSAIESALSRLDTKFQVLHGKLWSYITFPSNAEFAHIFFITYHYDQKYSTDYTNHSNGFDSIESVSIEGSENMLRFLESLGLKSKRDARGFTEFVTKTGSIIIKPFTHGLRPRINEVTFGCSSTDSTLMMKLD